MVKFLRRKAWFHRKNLWFYVPPLASLHSWVFQCRRHSCFGLSPYHSCSSCRMTSSSSPSPFASNRIALAHFQSLPCIMSQSDGNKIEGISELQNKIDFWGIIDKKSTFRPFKSAQTHLILGNNVMESRIRGKTEKRKNYICWQIQTLAPVFT